LGEAALDAFAHDGAYGGLCVRLPTWKSQYIDVVWAKPGLRRAIGASTTIYCAFRPFRARFGKKTAEFVVNQNENAIISR
jgi:hypothetical protein